MLDKLKKAATGSEWRRPGDWSTWNEGPGFAFHGLLIRSNRTALKRRWEFHIPALNSNLNDVSAADIVETVRDGLLVQDADLTVKIWLMEETCMPTKEWHPARAVSYSIKLGKEPNVFAINDLSSKQAVNQARELKAGTSNSASTPATAL